MDKEDFDRFFAKAPHRYPKELAEKYPRILNKILSAWESPEEQNDYLKELVVDTRGDRQGFPAKVMEELLFLHQLYARWLQEQRQVADPRVLMELDVKHVQAINQNQKALTPDVVRTINTMRLLIQKDDHAVAGTLASSGLSVNQKDQDGLTPLAFAAQAGAERVMGLLLKMKANPHVGDAEGNTPLHWAATMNKIKAAEMLLFYGGDPNGQNKIGATPLHMAAVKKESTLLRRLMDYGGDVSILDNFGNSPLHKAVQAKSHETTLILLKAGSNRSQVNRAGMSPEALAKNDAGMKSLIDNWVLNAARR